MTIKYENINDYQPKKNLINANIEKLIQNDDLDNIERKITNDEVQYMIKNKVNNDNYKKSIEPVKKELLKIKKLNSYFPKIIDLNPFQAYEFLESMFEKNEDNYIDAQDYKKIIYNHFLGEELSKEDLEFANSFAEYGLGDQINSENGMDRKMVENIYNCYNFINQPNEIKKRINDISNLNLIYKKSINLAKLINKAVKVGNRKDTIEDLISNLVNYSQFNKEESILNVDVPKINDYFAITSKLKNMIYKLEKPNEYLFNTKELAKLPEYQMLENMNAEFASEGINLSYAQKLKLIAATPILATGNSTFISQIADKIKLDGFEKTRNWLLEEN